MKKLLFCLAALPIVSGSIAAVTTMTGQGAEGNNNIHFEEKI